MEKQQIIWKELLNELRNSGICILSKHDLLTSDLKSLERYLDCEVKTTCNTIVSIQLARTAKKRADFLNHEKKYNIGISCTSALKTNRIRTGSDRAHISIFIHKKIFYKYIRLKTLTRLEQEKEISFYILNFIKETIG